MSTAGPTPLVDQVPVLGAAVWAEDHLADLEQRWADEGGEAELIVQFATNSAHHRWHADRLRDCLPDSPALEATAHVRPRSPGWERVLNGGVEPLPESWGRLVVLERLLDRGVAGYQELGGRLTPVSDGPTLRALDHVLRDQRAELETTRAMLAARAEPVAIAPLGKVIDELLDASE